MKVTLSVTELTKVFKEIQAQPERIFEMMRAETNHRNGSYERRFTMKRFGEVAVKGRAFAAEVDPRAKPGAPAAVEVPRDRNGEFRGEVLPRSKRYEDELRKDVCLMYLAGVLQGFKEPGACRRDRDAGRHGRIGGVGKKILVAYNLPIFQRVPLAEFTQNA